MIKIITAFVLALFALLPDSPVQAYLNDMQLDTDLLRYVNWFVPFDLAYKMTVTWLACIAAYYIFKIVKEIGWNLFVKNIISKLTS